MNISISGKLARSWLAGIIAVISLGLVSTALAVPPFKGSIGPFDVQGGFVADCDGFTVLGNYTVVGHFIVFFDKDGIVKGANVHGSFPDSIYYGVYYDDPNSETGYAEPEVFLAGGPGEGQNNKEIYTDGELTAIKITGPSFKLTVPGYGVVFLDGGQFIVAIPSGDILFQAGPHDFIDGEVDALCAVIQPIPYENDT